MKAEVINPNGAEGSLPSLKSAATIPLGQTYPVFELSKDSIKLVGLGHIEFNIQDFKIQS